MNFILKPSLERIALVKIAALLWNQPDIRALVTEFSNSFFPHLNPSIYSFNTFSESENSKWPKVQDKVIEKMAQLIIPTSLKEKLIGYVQTVGKEISKWIEYYIKFCCFDLDLPNEFCWTSQGTIDKKKTAEMLIRVDSIDIITRYKLACFHCLEDDIPELWNKVPESQREFLYNMYDVVSMTEIKKICVTKLVAFWTHGITIQDNRRYGSSTYQNLFRFAAESGNKVATEYFLQNFNLNEFLLNTAINVTKKLSFQTTGTVPEDNYSEVLCFLISEMSTDQQLKLFQQCPYKVLYCLLDWPFQSLFVETVKLLWDFLPKHLYHSVFLIIIGKEFLGYKDYNYKEVFRDIWQEISEADKSFIINDDRIAELLGNMLFRIKDKKNFKLILQSATPVEKSKVIFSDEGHYYCVNMIQREEWDLVEFFVQFLISSKSEMIKFKQEFQERVQGLISSHQIIKNLKGKDYWEEFSRILDDFIHGYDKRSIDEGETSSGKRLCNV